VASDVVAWERMRASNNSSKIETARSPLEPVRRGPDIWASEAGIQDERGTDKMASPAFVFLVVVGKEDSEVGGVRLFEVRIEVRMEGKGVVVGCDFTLVFCRM